MFINRVGAQFQCEGVTYTIGGKVCANDASDYEGLYGTITEIRDGDDRETETIPRTSTVHLCPLYWLMTSRP